MVHFTANDGDTAHNNAVYFQTPNIKASAHFFVDETEYWQSVRETDTAYHCGANKYRHPECRNDNSVGVELCSEKTPEGKYYFTPETVSRALVLLRQLMTKYDVPSSNVLRHYDVTGKNCPAPFVEDPAQWELFKARLTSKVITWVELEAMLHEKGIEQIIL